MLNKLIKNALKCPNCNSTEAVFWNKYKDVTQCHQCGTVKRGLLIDMLGRHRFKKLCRRNNG